MLVKLEKFRECARKVVRKENCILYDIQMTGSRSCPILRVFIDKEGQEGVSIDDCSQVSRGLDLILDTEGLAPDRSYQLEVSSPGLDRHLSENWHFKKAVGREISIQLKTSLEDIIPHLKKESGKRGKKRNLRGQLLKVDESSVELVVDQMDKKKTDSVVIPYRFIDKARVVFCHSVNHFKRKKNKKRKG